MKDGISEFIHSVYWTDLPTSVRHQAKRCLLDTIGAAIGGRQTALSQIIHDHVNATYGGELAQLWLDGRRVSPPGAALANGMTIDALDIHDGYHLNKGHIGAAIIPACLATLALEVTGGVSGRELLTTIVVGYEVAARAGRSLHATACDYHSSGAWSAIGCAAVAARRLQLDIEKTRHALGIAEYHGPRSQMMRCVDAPTMVKDGSGWGAMTGISAAMMAHGGFTGAPAITVESSDVSPLWSDLGQSWLIEQQYFKRYAVCYWAQPAIAAVRALQEQHQFAVETVSRIKVFTFHEATRLACRRPETTEEAQYSLPFPVAAALVYGRLGPRELSGESLRDPRVLALAEKVEMIEDTTFNAQFPAKRFARVHVEMAGGQVYMSADAEADWLPDRPPSDEALLGKFRWLSRVSLNDSRAEWLEQTIWQIESMLDTMELVAQLTAPPQEFLGLT